MRPVDCPHRSPAASQLRPSRSLALRSSRALVGVFASGLLLAGCMGSINDGAAERGDGAEGGDPGSQPDGVPLTTRVLRLSHSQYNHTVQDLLGVDARPAASFAGDVASEGFTNKAEQLLVDGRLGPQYRTAAEELAARSVADSASFAHVVPCDPAAAGCAEEFIQSFGTKAFRRPVSSDEKQRLKALFDKGAELVASGDAFRDGVRVVIEALLQSPDFLYRTELSDTRGEDGFVALNDWELASRLSYMLWDTMPDQELLDAAAAGELHTPEQIEAQVTRMLGDPRLKRPVEEFHEQWWDLNFEGLARDTEQFPEFTADIGPALEEEAQRFIEDVVFSGNGGIRELLTAPYTMADTRVAPLYGAEVTASFQRLNFDPEVRRGILMQSGFLASHAHFAKTSPIHRGVFVHRRIMCTTLPDPPASVDFTLPPFDENIRTTRDQVTHHTSKSACVGCHSMINPVGFAFENFDAVGRERRTENDVEVDTTGAVLLDGSEKSFANAVELVEALGESQQVRECYAGAWLRYVYQRDKTPSDRTTIEELSRPGLSVKEVMRGLTRTKAFRVRAPNRVGQ